MNAYGTITEAGSVRFERLLPGPIERVWAYLTESDKRGEWLATGDTEPFVGGRVELNFRHADLTPHDETPPGRFRKMEGGVSFEGRVTEFDPPRLLSYTWPGEKGESEVTFELSERGEDVLLVLTHRRLVDRTAMLSVAGGWHTHLGILVDKLAGREPAPFWATFAKIEAEYEARL